MYIDDGKDARRGVRIRSGTIQISGPDSPNLSAPRYRKIFLCSAVLAIRAPRFFSVARRPAGWQAFEEYRPRKKTRHFNRETNNRIPLLHQSSVMMQSRKGREERTSSTTRDR